ncbi:quinone-dependent dihydroorotate dehydrogenase [Membranihabitans marinus]
MAMALFENSLRLPLSHTIFKQLFTLESEKLKCRHMGLEFQNPIGLAAGFDKDGKYIANLSKLGFGFIEIGTVTPKPQIGNDKPRLFRLPKDQALINRMGFNNDGVDAMANRLKDLEKGDLIIGGNIGKNKITNNEDAWKDYVQCFNTLNGLVDYFVINVSSPNTPGLRELQNKESLTRILSEVQNINNKNTPVLLKIAPDINEAQLDDIIEVITHTGLQGIVTNNTTIARQPLNTDPITVADIGAGGLSGRPLQGAANQLLAQVKERTSSNQTIIASGGVHDTEAVVQKLELGADLVQVYTGFIYQGPDFVKKILQSII